MAMRNRSERPRDESAQPEFPRYQRFGVPMNPFGGLLELVVAPVWDKVQIRREQRANASMAIAATLAAEQVAVVENLPSDL